MNKDLELLYETILLEKDHRQKMIKFGIEPNVAEYLHAIDDKYSLWFANQLKGMPQYERAANKISFVATLRQTMTQILDWIKGAQDVNINAFKWDDAIRKSEEWHEEIAKTPEEKVESLSQTVAEYESGVGEILKIYDDGYYWIDLQTNNSREEGNCMGHCGRTDSETIWSLRNINNFYTRDGVKANSYVTAGVSPDEGVWRQAKGKNNKMPNEEYWPYIVDIFVEGKIFEYKSEYAGNNDFGVEEFKSYLEENPDKYENTDEILEKLSESGIQARADKLYEEYRDLFKKIDVNYEVEEDYINPRGYSGFDITPDDMPDIAYLVNKKLDDYRSEDRKILMTTIRESLDKMHIYLSDDWNYGTPYEIDRKDGDFTLQIYMDFDDDRSGYGDEIDHFKNFLDDMVSYDEIISGDSFVEDFVEIFTEKLEDLGWIDTDRPKPKLPDPRQMKFPGFDESTTFKAYAKHVGLI